MREMFRILVAVDEGSLIEDCVENVLERIRETDPRRFGVIGEKLIEVRQGDHDDDLFRMRDGVLVVVTDTMRLGRHRVMAGVAQMLAILVSTPEEVSSRSLAVFSEVMRENFADRFGETSDIRSYFATALTASFIAEQWGFDDELGQSEMYGHPREFDEAFLLRPGDFLEDVDNAILVTEDYKLERVPYLDPSDLEDDDEPEG